MNKNIFSYFNGKENVFADPSEIDYQLVRASENEDMTNLLNWVSPAYDELGNMDESEGKLKLVVLGCHALDPIVRKAFGIEPFNTKTGEGLLEEDVIAVYAGFVKWRFNLKKNTEQPPTSATSTDSPETSSTKSTTTSASMD